MENKTIEFEQILSLLLGLREVNKKKRIAPPANKQTPPQQKPQLNKTPTGETITISLTFSQPPLGNYDLKPLVPLIRKHLAPEKTFQFVTDNNESLKTQKTIYLAMFVNIGRGQYDSMKKFLEEYQRDKSKKPWLVIISINEANQSQDIPLREDLVPYVESFVNMDVSSLYKVFLSNPKNAVACRKLAEAMNKL